MGKDKQKYHPCFSATCRRVVKGGQPVALPVPAQGSELGSLRSARVSIVGQRLLGWRPADVDRGLVEKLGEGRAFFFSTFALQSPFNNLSCQKEMSNTDKTSGLLLHQISPRNNRLVGKSWPPCSPLHQCWGTARWVPGHCSVHGRLEEAVPSTYYGRGGASP